MGKTFFSSRIMSVLLEVRSGGKKFQAVEKNCTYSANGNTVLKIFLQCNSYHFYLSIFYYCLIKSCYSKLF